MSLLEKAKSLKEECGRLRYGQEQAELAVAWIRGDVSLKQVAFALGKTQSQSIKAYNFLTLALREAYRLGILKDGANKL